MNFYISRRVCDEILDIVFSDTYFIENGDTKGDSIIFICQDCYLLVLFSIFFFFSDSYYCAFLCYIWISSEYLSLLSADGLTI